MHLLVSSSTVLLLSLTVSAFYTPGPSLGTSPRRIGMTKAARNRLAPPRLTFEQQLLQLPRTRIVSFLLTSSLLHDLHPGSGTTPLFYGSAASNTGTFFTSPQLSTVRLEGGKIETTPSFAGFTTATVSEDSSTTEVPSTTTKMTTVTTEYKTGITEASSAASDKMNTTEAPKSDIPRFNDSIYRFASNLDSVEGEEFCKSLGGLWNLASIHSRTENDFVLAQLAARFPEATAAWLGGFKEGGKMTWIDGKPWNFENWASGASQSDGDCLQLLLNANGTWRSENCASKSAAVVCKCTGEHCPVTAKDPLPEKPEEVLPGAFNASDYPLTVGMDSVEGEEYCKRLGGLSNLASIHSAAENEFVAALVKKQHPEAKSALIGGYKEGDAFTWIDGSSWDYEAWGAGRPASVNSAGCTYMSFTGVGDGKWLDEFCGERADVVVCKISQI